MFRGLSTSCVRHTIVLLDFIRGPRNETAGTILFLFHVLLLLLGAKHQWCLGLS